MDSERGKYKVTVSITVDVWACDEIEAEDIVQSALLDEGAPCWFVEMLGFVVVEHDDPNYFFPMNEEDPEDE